MKRFLWILIILFYISIFVLFIKAIEYNIPVSVSVLPIYNLSIDIDILTEVTAPEKDLSVFIELEKTDLTDISKEIVVDLNYEIIKGRKVINGNFLQTIDITEHKEEIVNIKIPPDLKGSYILKIIASNPQSYSDEDKDKFFIWRKWWKLWMWGKD